MTTPVRFIGVGTYASAGRQLQAAMCVACLATFNISASAWGQETNSRIPSVRWDDGSVDLHAPEFAAFHTHDHSGAQIEDTPEIKRLKARMTPEERSAFDEKRRAEESHEILARILRFATLPGSLTSGEKSPEAVWTEAEDAYGTAFQEFRSSVSNLVLVMHRFALNFDSTPEINQSLETKWVEALQEAHSSRERWLQQAMAIYLSDTDKYQNVGLAIKEMLFFDVEKDRFDAWKLVVKDLGKVDEALIDTPWLMNSITVALACNEYDIAIELGKRYAELLGEDGLPDMQRRYLESFETLKKEWEREQTIRAEEALADKNPRIELITTKGRIVIELFEESAPQAVANMIYLIERKFYDRKTFFRVEHLTVAQTGCEKGDGSGDAGYTIASDLTEDNYRAHFRGSCAIALGSVQGEADPSSGSSQFYIAQMPLEHLNKTYTVFGRVIEGLDTIGLLRQMNLADESERKEGKSPDLIIRANVLRKGDHEYKPTPVRGKLFR